MHFSFFAVARNTSVSDGQTEHVFLLEAQQCGSFGSRLTGQPPSDNAGKHGSNNGANGASEVVRTKFVFS